MLNTYEIEVTCICPVDDLPDVYHLTVTARRVIPVEDLIKAVFDVREHFEFYFRPSSSTVGIRNVVRRGRSDTSLISQFRSAA